MTKGVLVHGGNSKYDDEPGSHYHFPKRYLRRMEAIQNDWVVYFTPVKDLTVSPLSRGAYSGVAKIGAIRPDPAGTDLFYADIVPETYASFARPVSRLFEDRFLETNLQKADGKANTGHALQAVRYISDIDFARIVSLGWQNEEAELPRIDQLNEGSISGFDDEPIPFQVERKVVSSLQNKTLRDRRFRLSVLNAYDKKCAVTGWRFVNGGGRAEVEGAHIKPVEHGGPDSIKNGLALSGTVHWMFDRGLISAGEGGEILISRKVNDVDGLKAIINPTGCLLVPENKPEFHPHPRFLAWHRGWHGF
ncbi:HNH endonuclease [Aquisalinus flavus]|uniref:Restriction endonuclease n=1 Tax=Aquisalinus flavus TaxID=1526572 RepID=A0A8J2Y624_9PROT|nr:HNH endonuclease [Aquisalinus flavus]MBD0427871.1 HNH endonuclease [Aquisalinus flavus]UNE47634.1 restriction endonuclease [Aquisalinus flavus]GGD04549.1 restriction endonuclease [Aquisalinus flavus]